MSDSAAEWLPLLQTLPVPLAALLMQQVLRSEVMFPPEKLELEATLERLRSPRSAEMDHAVAAFGALRIPPGMTTTTWQNEPVAWVESFTAGMWSTGQIEAYRNAAKLAIRPLPAVPTDNSSRVVVIVFDRLLKSEEARASLFRRLRPAGTLYTSVRDAAASGPLAAWLVERARLSKEAYSHWYVSGEDTPAAIPGSAPFAALSYEALQPARQRLLRMMNAARNAMGTGGPEGLRRSMQALTPDEMGLPPHTDPVLRAFATDVLVGGSGTQLYSTTFVQWTAREVLRRAQPQTLIARFTARNQSASMDLRLAEPTREPPLDFSGSLVDAEMGAHLTYLNLLRLPGAERSHFLALHEGYGQAVLIGAGVKAGAESVATVSVPELLKQIA